MQEEQNEEVFSKYINILIKSNYSVRDILESLQTKKIVLASYSLGQKGTVFNPYEVPFNKNFIKDLHKYSFDLGKELFEAYPQFGNINGNLVPLRSVAKRFDSLEECYFRYGKEIKWNLEIHNNIIDLVKWANEHNIINCSLASFIINNGWIDLQALKDGDGNINYDSIKLL